MKKQSVYSLFFVFALILGANVFQQVGRAESAKPVEIGEVVSDFKAKDIGGNEHSLAALKGKNGTVLIFISVQCPISNAYNERMEKLAQDYAAKGVNVIGINANSTESVADVKQHASKHGFTFTIIKDDGNKIADQLGAEHTPEAYLLNADGKLVYRGRIDNQKNADIVSASDLRDAIDETLAGQPVKKPVALAFGCSIKRG